MILRHTFKKLIETVVMMEAGIETFEKAVNCHIDDNWMTNGTSNIIRAIAEGFFEKIDINSLEEDQADTIEELLYHFIYMEDCGNESEHCREKLVRISNDEEEKALSCTNIDELYGVIRTYLDRQDINFHFNYCHSHKQDDELKEVV
jgi:hypothetical protein